MRREQQQRLQTETRVDWFAIFVDLSRKGLTVAGVAETIAIPKSTLLGWKQGAEPKHADGERLIDLWARMTDKPREQVPMTNAPPWLG